MSEFFEFGEPFGAQTEFSVSSARATQRALRRSRDFKTVEFRRTTTAQGFAAEVIVVDCLNDQVPSRNIAGIKARERLALVFYADPSQPPAVRALRRSFPVVPHLNHVTSAEPAWLCLYAEPWSATERSWTPERFLARILWWLSSTANGALHREDQPVEQLFFESPHRLLLPPDFLNKVQDPRHTLHLASVEAGNRVTIRSSFTADNNQAVYGKSPFHPLVLLLPSVVHGAVQRHPTTLGELDDQFVARGVSLIEKLRESFADPAKIDRKIREGQVTILILWIPVTRTVGDEAETYDRRAYMITQGPASLAVTIGIFQSHEGWAVSLLGNASAGEGPAHWRAISVNPMEVSDAVNRSNAQRLSGVSSDTANFRGVLAGVGALGSMLAQIWAKQAWGTWTYVDPDTVLAHNVVRHLAFDAFIGRYKCEAVCELTRLNYQDSQCAASAIASSATAWDNVELLTAVDGAMLLIDATTTLDVPRDLARRNHAARGVSVFITPSGNGSVMLLEDKERTIRLDVLEAQYYRAILSSDWGGNHLENHRGSLWVGAGCRDSSLVLPCEVIQLHAATLARQLRSKLADVGAQICVWTIHDSGEIAARTIPVAEARSWHSEAWTAVLDLEIVGRLSALRSERVPDETGGIIVGYIDQKSKRIYVVDVLASPPDSQGNISGFTRGIEGLDERIQEIRGRTANIVDYIGEWHSHPPFVSAQPSRQDRYLATHLAGILAQEGLPFVMIIVGTAGEVSVTIEQTSA